MAEIKSTSSIGFEKQIWDAACILHGNMDASEYKHVVLGLIFLKYISDCFDEKHRELVEEGDGFEEDIDEYKKRVPLSGAQREKRQGKYRYYGAQGVIDHIDDFLFDGTYLLIAEDGENLKSKKQNIAQVVEGQFWVNNHAHIVQGNELCDTRFLCYLLNSMDLSGYVTGSAQPKLSQANMNAVSLLLPSIDIQKRIVECLCMFDEKITINNAINDNLAA